MPFDLTQHRSLLAEVYRAYVNNQPVPGVDVDIFLKKNLN